MGLLQELHEENTKTVITEGPKLDTVRQELAPMMEQIEQLREQYIKVIKANDPAIDDFINHRGDGKLVNAPLNAFNQAKSAIEELVGVMEEIQNTDYGK